MGKKGRKRLQTNPGILKTAHSALFHFLALVSFLARPKPRIPFLGLSLLLNQTETLTKQATRERERTNRQGKGERKKRFYRITSWPDFPFTCHFQSILWKRIYQLHINISSIRISLHSFFYFEKSSTWNWRLPFAVNVISAIIRYRTIISEGTASLLQGLTYNDR